MANSHIKDVGLCADLARHLILRWLLNLSMYLIKFILDRRLSKFRWHTYLRENIISTICANSVLSLVSSNYTNVSAGSWWEQARIFSEDSAWNNHESCRMFKEITTYERGKEKVKDFPIRRRQCQVVMMQKLES